MIARKGGLIVALEGLCPEGGEPQLGFLRELSTGLPLRSGGLSRQDQLAFETFLSPLKARGGPIAAVLSDKQRGLVPAVAALFPDLPHQFCQSPSLRNLAEPLASADQAFKVTLRKALRTEIGEWIRTENESDPTPGVGTVTGLLPSADPTPTEEARAAPETGAAPEPGGRLASSVDSAAPPSAAETLAPPSDAPRPDRQNQVVIALLRRIRSLLTLEGRPPFRLAGVELYTRVIELTELIRELLGHPADPRLRAVLNGLDRVLPAFAGSAQELQQGAQWLTEIAKILQEPIEGSLSGEQVAGHLEARLAELQAIPLVSRDGSVSRSPPDSHPQLRFGPLPLLRRPAAAPDP